MTYGVFDVLTLLGSLGLFLYGMKVMSDSLMKLAGGKMREILAKATANRFFAVSTGFFITAAIQSSSATTLMVVSFVNANLLTLSEAVGVIMGANIGTTVTAWLISLLGFKVKISALALPLVGFGFLLSLSKKSKTRYWGKFLIGFSILFIGLQFLKDAVPDISAYPETLQFLKDYTSKGYLSILLFLAIGTLLTLIVQSSSATMAITILMCHEGWIPFDMAAAMILGENIGTTVTANMAAFVANFQAKRAARAHLIFNLLGVLWLLLLFFPFIEMVAAAVEHIEGVSPLTHTIAIPVALSLFHTSFNICNSFVLIWFLPIIVRTVEKLVPEQVEDHPEIDVPRYLDKTAMRYPVTGIKALEQESIRLLENAAYKVMAHGLWVHRADLEKQQPMKSILSKSEQIDIDIEQVYKTKIRSIYSEILEYATQLQSKEELTPDQIEQVRNILTADRLLVNAVKRMIPLHLNLERYMSSDNPAIRKEYNILRKRILKLVRQIKRIANSEDLSERLVIIRRHRVKAKKLDVLLSGRLDTLLVENQITQDMAASLLNDCHNAERITKNLADVALLLYQPKDKFGEVIEARAIEDETTINAELQTSTR